MLKTSLGITCWYKNNAFILASVLALVLSGCEKEENKKVDTSKKIAVVVYMAAENNLSNDANLDFNEMILGCKYMTDNDRLFVYMDNANNSALPCIYEISKNDIDNIKNKEIKPSFTYDTDHNSASTNTLGKVLDHVYTRFGADSYRLVLWSHGSGWVPSMSDIKANIRPTLKAFGVDTGNNDKYSSMGSQMDITDLAKTLEKRSPLELIMFDACFMQTIEVAYELRKSSRYIIGSPAEIPGWGAPYDDILHPLFTDSLDVNAVISSYQKNYKENHSWFGILLSAIDCQEIEEFAQIHKEMMHKYCERPKEVDLNGVQNYFIFDDWKSMSDLPDQYDIKGLMQRIITNEEDYIQWETSLNRLIPHSCHDNTWYTMYTSNTQEVDAKQYSGLSMYLEQEKYSGHYYYDGYHQTGWAKAMK